uniref:Uncharacterized protein n=1 Tax=Panagrolaimus sp. ES5 TaxID=591445 RepID=A0AC34GHF1_9BILA
MAKASRIGTKIQSINHNKSFYGIKACDFISVEALLRDGLQYKNLRKGYFYFHLPRKSGQSSVGRDAYGTGGEATTADPPTAGVTNETYKESGDTHYF